MGVKVVGWDERWVWNVAVIREKEADRGQIYTNLTPNSTWPIVTPAVTSSHQQ